MVFIEPIMRTAYQKIPNFITSIVKNIAAPIGMKSFPRVLMLVEIGSIEKMKPVLVSRKMGRNPVYNNSYVILMQVIHKVHKFIGITEPAGWCKIPGYLITP